MNIHILIIRMIWIHYEFASQTFIPVWYEYCHLIMLG